MPRPLHCTSSRLQNPSVSRPVHTPQSPSASRPVYAHQRKPPRPLVFCPVYIRQLKLEILCVPPSIKPPAPAPEPLSTRPSIHLPAQAPESLNVTPSIHPPTQVRGHFLLGQGLLEGKCVLEKNDAEVITPSNNFQVPSSDNNFTVLLIRLLKFLFPFE